MSGEITNDPQYSYDLLRILILMVNSDIIEHITAGDTVKVLHCVVFFAFAIKKRRHKIYRTEHKLSTFYEFTL